MINHVNGILDSFGIKNAKKILDVGTGSGIMATALAELGYSCITIEKNERAIEAAKQNFDKISEIKRPTLIQVDICNMLEGSPEFDLITCYQSFHHFKRPYAALHSMINQCIIGGSIIIIEHNRRITNAMNLLLSKKRVEHPSSLNLEQIERYLSQMNFLFAKSNTEIGDVLCIEKKEEYCQHYFSEDQDYVYTYSRTEKKIQCISKNTGEVIRLGGELSSNNASKVLCLNVANDCNLRCIYCYAHGGNYDNKRELMNEEVAQKAVEWYKNNIKLPEHILFFGGEPLLNYDVIEKTIKYVRTENPNATFSLTTNGTLLRSEVAQGLHESGVKVTISIDGKKEVHDHLRVDANGRPTYDRIIHNIKQMNPEQRDKLWCKMTITRYTENILECVKDLLAIGIKNIDMAFVVDSIFLAEEKGDVDDIIANLQNLAELAIAGYISGQFRIYPFLKIYDSIIFGYRASKTCTAGEEMICVLPGGELVPCFRFSENIIGNIASDKLDTELQSNFVQMKTDIIKKRCSDCWCYDFCGGFCPKDVETYEKIGYTRCRITQELIKAALIIVSNKYMHSKREIDKIVRRSAMLDLIARKRELI